MKERNNMCQLDNYCLFLVSKYFETIDYHINLIQTNQRLRLNMEKFHFNPVTLTKDIRNFFPNLQTLYVYSKEDELFEDDKRIIERKIQTISYCIKEKEKMNFEEWS